ncbi:transmembrane emp24 domain-containing protein 6, partial [Larimichthys crocea]|uniref:transmembrane emp24 domain-containing protein 6 n=1 Tax=Larimichthys crocea TaxID=215358 RepID=UPI000F5EE432
MERVKNVKTNKELCQQIAQRVRALEDLVLNIKQRGPRRISSIVKNALKELCITLESAQRKMYNTTVSCIMSPMQIFSPMISMTSLYGATSPTNSGTIVLSSQCVWARKSEPSFNEADAGLFRGSDKYDFAIEVPAAEMECFWHFAHQSGSFYLMYMVQWVTGMANDPRLFVTVNSPQGVLMASKNEAVGQLNFQTEVTGFYRMCLGNHNNKFGGIRVFMNFGVIYEGFVESKGEMEEGEKVLNSTLTDIE